MKLKSRRWIVIVRHFHETWFSISLAFHQVFEMFLLSLVEPRFLFRQNHKQGVARKALADNFDRKTLTLTHPRAHWGKARGRGKPPRLDLFLLPSHRSLPCSSRTPDPSFSPASKRLLIRFPPSTSGAAKTTFLVVDPKWVSWEVSLSNTKHQQFQGGSFC